MTVTLQKSLGILFIRGEIMKKLTLVHSDYDYSPVVVHLEGHGVLLMGDNGHNRGYEDYVDGFIEASEINGVDLELVDIRIDCREDLDSHEELLKHFMIYNDYVEIINEEEF